MHERKPDPSDPGSPNLFAADESAVQCSTVFTTLPGSGMIGSQYRGGNNWKRLAAGAERKINLKQSKSRTSERSWRIY